jgi:Protein of unknown function (DUF3237)
MARQAGGDRRGRQPPREIGATPRGGTRRFFPVVVGDFEGPRLRGEVLPDGGDWALYRADGTLEVDVRLTLRTDDGALIYVRYEGVRRASPEVLARLGRGEPVDPAEYYFRTAPVFETGAVGYAWLNDIVAAGVGERPAPGQIRYSVFEIL